MLLFLFVCYSYELRKEKTQKPTDRTLTEKDSLPLGVSVAPQFQRSGSHPVVYCLHPSSPSHSISCSYYQVLTLLITIKEDKQGFLNILLANYNGYKEHTLMKSCHRHAKHVHTDDGGYTQRVNRFISRRQCIPNIPY